MRYSTNTDIQASAEHFEISTDSIMTDILREHKARKAGTGTKKMVGMASLLDMDLANEVGRLTPPVRIYRVGPDGELILKEQIQALTFRRRVMESIGGVAFQERIDELQRKRRKAGQRSKAKGRAARIRSGLGARTPIAEEEDDAE
jgi:hypothetical protein